ncbi:MAG: tRNA lysidine(34) synthetase TilS [Nitrosomonadales bacterium]|nr:tRNA lysidine(34) synthetase TilS [Nitrosomonadales bacterium]
MVPHNRLVERVAVQLAPLLPVHSSILVGLSGGVDSVALLHILHKLAPRFSWQLSALHVHHGISPNADAWSDFCAELCARLYISLHIERVDISPLRGHGIEAAARKLRRAAFAAQACDFVAVAHHADDQAETLLLQLLRGAGVRGASAMPVLGQSNGPVLITGDLPARGLSRMASSSSSQSNGPGLAERSGSVPMVRPLLHCTRQEIVDYALAHQLRWIEDESNASDSYPRNFLRHRVLPLLGERFPAYRNTLARSAQHFAEASLLLDELAQQDAAKQAEGETLDIAVLQALSQPRAKNLLRYFLHSRGASMPQAVQMDDMLQQLCNARADAIVCIAYGDWQVRRYQGKVHVWHALGDFDPSLMLPWSGETGLHWPALNTRLHFKHTRGAGINLEKLRRGPVTLRLRNGGEALRPHAHGATRKLKNLLQEHRVPPWLRDRLPLLYCGDELVCVPGVAVAAEYQADGHEAAIQVELQGTRTGKA